MDEGIYSIHDIEKKRNCFFSYFPYKICRDPPVGHIAVNVLRRIPQFDELVDFVEKTLLYQTLYLEFYSNSKWLKYRHQIFINQLCKVEEMQNSSSFYFFKIFIHGSMQLDELNPNIYIYTLPKIKLKDQYWVEIVFWTSVISSRSQILWE